MRTVWREPYIISNAIFAGVLAVILAYFGFFSSSDTYPIHAVVSGQLTSTGLQRALSEWMHGNVAAALQFNKYSLGIFAFFVSQLFMRLICSFIFIAGHKKNIVVVDAVISIVLFLCAFAPMAIMQIVEG